jgi:hypothetical protein
MMSSQNFSDQVSGQVLKPASSIGIVGDGKVARHFEHWFKSLNIPVATWSRRKSSVEKTTPEQALASCKAVFLLVSDPVIDELASRFNGDTPWLFHCSGSWVSRFPRVLGAHPLMSFGPELYEPACYAKIPFVLEAGAESRFKLAFPQLENPLYTIPRDARAKAKYHALCAMAGSFTSFLWAKLFTELPKLYGIPPEAASPFLRQLAENLANHPHEPQRFFTGPIARGDSRTVNAHLEALAGDPYASIYEGFVRLFKEHPPQ